MSPAIVAPPLLDSLSPLPDKQRRHWASSLWWIASGVACAVSLFWLNAQSNCAMLALSREPEFCVQADGSILYIDKGSGGSDIYRFDRKTRTSKVIATTPYYESEPDVSPDGTTVVCRYRGGQPSADGLELIDIATGHVTRLTNGYWSGRDLSPHFNPDGKKILFGRIGVSFTTNDVTELHELDLQTRKSTQVTQVKYFSVCSPLYCDRDNLFFSADIPKGDGGEGQWGICEWSRGAETRTTLLPTDTIMQLIGKSPDAKTLYALTSREMQQNNSITLLKATDIATPSKWNVLPIHTSDAKFEPSQNEILYRNENAKYYVICGYSLTDKKTRHYVKIRK